MEHSINLTFQILMENRFVFVFALKLIISGMPTEYTLTILKSLEYPPLTKTLHNMLLSAVLPSYPVVSGVAAMLLAHRPELSSLQYLKS